MPTTHESQLMAVPRNTVILSGDHFHTATSVCQQGIRGGATPSAPQTNYRQMLTPSAPPSFHPARPACRKAGSA